MSRKNWFESRQNGVGIVVRSVGTCSRNLNSDHSADFIEMLSNQWHLCDALHNKAMQRNLYLVHIQR